MKRFCLPLLSLLFVLASVLAAESADAASVKKAMAKKGVIVVDEGPSGGFTKGAKVCFLNGSKKLGCGKVVRAKGSQAFVKVSKKAARKIKAGMSAELQGGGGGSAVASKGGGKSMSNVKLGYFFTPIAPSSYQKLSYNRPESGAPNRWAATKAASLSLLGLGAEFEYGLGSISMATGLRLRMYGDFTSQSDYSNDAFKFAEITESGKAIGLWFDAYYLNMPFSPSFIFRVGNGLDIDMASVTLKATQKHDQGQPDVPLASATSSLNVISLRTLLGFHYLLGSVGLNLNMNLLIPLVAMGGKFSGEVTDPQAVAAGPDQAVADLKTAFAHKKASFGLELMFGAYFMF